MAVSSILQPPLQGPSSEDEENTPAFAHRARPDTGVYSGGAAARSHGASRIRVWGDLSGLAFAETNSMVSSTSDPYIYTDYGSYSEMAETYHTTPDSLIPRQ